MRKRNWLTVDDGGGEFEEAARDLTLHAEKDDDRLHNKTALIEDVQPVGQGGGSV